MLSDLRRPRRNADLSTLSEAPSSTQTAPPVNDPMEKNGNVHLTAVPIVDNRVCVSGRIISTR
jgi:hypothetical protein